MAVVPVQTVLSLNADTNVNGLASFATPTMTAATAGNTICGAFEWVAGATTASLGTITDNAGNTYTKSTATHHATDGNNFVMFFKEGITGAPTVITVARVAGQADFTFCRITATEFSGVVTTSAADPAMTTPAAQTGVAATANANLIKSVSATTTVNGDLIYAASVQTDAGTGILVGTTFTNLIYGANGDVVPMRAEYKIQATAGAVTGDFNGVAATHNYITGMITLKAAAAGDVFFGQVWL